MEEGGLPWLSVRAGVLYDSAGRVVRLIGLRVDGLPAERGDARSSVAAEAAPTTLLSAVPEGRRCVALPMQALADMKPAALAGLDAAVEAHATAGAYTLLRIEPRLWLQDHHLQLARRYAGQPAVLFALLGREDLADALAKAALALRSVHAGACLWLPLAAARSTFAALPDPRIGLLWNAADPQGPRPPALTGCLRAPVLLDGWQPNALHPLADERLMRLCREAGIGWLASLPDQPRSRLALQRAALLSRPDDDPTEPLPLAA